MLSRDPLLIERGLQRILVHGMGGAEPLRQRVGVLIVQARHRIAERLAEGVGKRKTLIVCNAFACT